LIGSVVFASIHTDIHTHQPCYIKTCIGTGTSSTSVGDVC